MDEPRLVGGHVALDLINTVAPRLPGATASAGATDWLDTAAELLRWANRVDLITQVEADAVEAAWADLPASAGQALHAALDVREATYAVLMAALGVPRAATEGAAAELERLVLRWSAAMARSVLRLGGVGGANPVGPGVARVGAAGSNGAGAAHASGPPAILWAGSPGAMLIPDRLAHAAVDLVRTADLAQLRICPVDEGGCGWLFLDRSRNRSRRWCAMEDCGTLAKSRRLTTRRRSARATSLDA